MSRPVCDEAAAVNLARAIADAINPERPADTALLGNALFYPLALRTIAVLADRGWYLAPDAPAAAA